MVKYFDPKHAHNGPKHLQKPSSDTFRPVLGIEGPGSRSPGFKSHEIRIRRLAHSQKVPRQETRFGSEASVV